MCVVLLRVDSGLFLAVFNSSSAFFVCNLCCHVSAYFYIGVLRSKVYEAILVTGVLTPLEGEWNYILKWVFLFS